MKEIGDLEIQMNELELGIENKRGPLMVSTTRTEIRESRPRVEYCNDPPKGRLQEEQAEIRRSIAR